MSEPRDRLEGARLAGDRDAMGSARGGGLGRDQGDALGGDRGGGLGPDQGGDRGGAGRDHGGGLDRGQRGGIENCDRGGALERLIDGVARAQPARRAPASLEARVFAQIAARPWWSKGFAHWPVFARAAFLVASFGFIKLALVGAMWAIDFVRTSDVAGVDALHRTSEAVSTTVSLGSLVFNAIPPVWLYIGAGVGFMLYAVLFGLGTFAYRTLYVQR